MWVCCLYPRRALDRECRTFKPPRVTQEQEEDAKPKKLEQVRIAPSPEVATSTTYRSSCHSPPSGNTSKCTYVCRVIDRKVFLRIFCERLSWSSLTPVYVCNYKPAQAPATFLALIPPIYCRSHYSRGSRRKLSGATRNPRRRSTNTRNEK